MTQADANLPAPPPPTSASPRWNTATKFLVALAVVAVLGWLLVQFQQLIAPLLFAFVLAYLLNPVAVWLTSNTRLSWGMAVNLVFLALVVGLIGVLAAAGIAIERQAVGLYSTVVDLLPNLPDRLQAFLAQTLVIGPFKLDLATADLTKFYDQLVAALQPALSQTGTVVGSLASGTVEVLGWALFVLVASFYLLHDLKRVVPSITELLPEGYAPDVQRLAAEIGPIWNAFLRGQVTLALVMGVVVGLSMWALGVRYPLVLGLLAGLLEFIPIIGPFSAGAVAVLIALFQPSNYFGWDPFYFALLVVGVQLLLSQLENNFLVPRIIGGSLNLHPIVILVGATVAASLAGIVGLLLSAPLLATLRLFGRYLYRKLFDLDPWPEPPPQPATSAKPILPRWLTKLLPGPRSPAPPKSNSQP